MNIKEMTLLSIYKMSAVDGKIGGGAKRVSKLLDLSTNELEQKLDTETFLHNFNNLSKDSKEAILATVEFIMNADGHIDNNEIVLFNKMSNLL